GGGGVSPCISAPTGLTVRGVLRQDGSPAACIGKWLLGMGWTPRGPAALPFGDSARTADPRTVDYTKPIANGPNALGFDYFFGIAASLDMPPYAFIENTRVTELPTVEKQWAHRQGPAAPDFEAVDVLP